MRLNFFTPTRKPVGYITTANGRRRRVYDAPATPWQRVKASGILTEEQITAVEARIQGVNPADLTCQINAIQTQLTKLAQAKTEAITASRPLNLESLQPSINRLTPTKRKPSSAQSV